MTRLNRSARRLLLALPIAALAVPAVADATSATVAPPATLGELLAMVPADAAYEQSALITYIDMALLWERIGASDEASRLDALGGPAARQTFSVTPQLFDNRLAQVEEAEAEVGFNFTHIDRELAVIAYPRQIVIDVTTASPDTIDAAITSNPVWAEHVTRVDTDHGSYVDWGDGTEVNRTGISPLRPLGQAGQFAVLGDPATTVRTILASDADAVLATADGDGDSALTTPVLGPIAEVLGGDVVLQAVIQPIPNLFMPSPGSLEEIEADMEQARFVLPYVGLGVVEVADGDTTRTEVLLVHFDAGSAAANVERVEVALAEGVDATTQIPLAETFPDATVTVDGNVVRVDVSGDGAFRKALQRLMDRGLFPTG